MRIFFLTLLFILQTPSDVLTFIPAALIDSVFSKLDSIFLKTLDITADTITHDDIIKYGAIQSVVQYFYNQTNGTRLVNLTKADNDYYDLKNLYHDYYGVWLCNLEINNIIKYVLKPSVASVDLDPDTKDFPYAHFDAETFIPSNERVIKYTNDVFNALNNLKYDQAQMLSGQILHTIQDFYSHSNWVEMGKNDINYDIGKSNFSQQPIVNQNDTDVCANNCTLQIIECDTLLSIITKLINLAGLKLSIVSCPLTYYKCSSNINLLSKLVSGYYGGQKLQNGQDYSKPSNLGKCSHGGMFDKTANEISQGGINKDSGYYIVSPHAHLHQTAAKLAIKHTKYFFENIRNTIGDKQFAKFLSLELTPEQIGNASRTYSVCGGKSVMMRVSSNYFLFLCIISINYLFL